MDSQASFRLPKEMLLALGRIARDRGVPKSQVVREALELYLSDPVPAQSTALSLRDRSAPYIGSINLSGPGDAEDIAVRIRHRNWR